MIDHCSEFCQAGSLSGLSDSSRNGSGLQLSFRVQSQSFRVRLTAWWIALATVLSGIPVPGIAQDMTVKSYMDRNTIGLNQQFTLNVELSGSRANEAGSPELPDMKDFAAFLGSSTSQSFQFINGKTAVSLTTSYHFQAVKEGKFTIGAVSVKAGGKTLKTEPIQITIQKGAATQQPAGQSEDGGPSENELYLQATVNKRRVFQNEPVIVTFKIYTTVDVSSYGLKKLPATTGFWVEEYDLGQIVPTNEVVNGRRYTVALIKKMALFPMAAGRRTIDPMVITCEVRTQRRSRDLFDDFFNNSFFGRTVSRSIGSKPISIEVKPLPEEGRPADFNGIVGAYTMETSLDKHNVKTHEAVTLRLTIQGRGNIQAIPEPDMNFPPDIESYDPKMTKEIVQGDKGISGHKTFEYVLIPRVPGIHRIKPVEFSFFNPETGSYETLRSEEIVINAAKGEDILGVVPGGLTKKEVDLLGEDIRFIKSEKPTRQGGDMGVIHNTGFWAAAVLPLLVLLGAFGFRRHQDKLMEDVAYARGRRATGAAKKRLSVARSYLDLSRQKEFYAAIHKALSGYLADKMNIAEAGMIFSQVREKLTKRGVPGAAVQEVFDCLETCDRMRFSPTQSTVDEMREFIGRAEDAMSILDREMARL